MGITPSETLHFGEILPKYLTNQTYSITVYHNTEFHITGLNKNNSAEKGTRMSEILPDNNAPLDRMSIEPLEREQRLYERVVEKVLELISSGAWKPGYRLPPERELSEAFGVSRTVVREAVKALEARGVLESTTGSGVSVREADFNMVSRSLQTYMQLSNLVDFEIRLNEVRRVLDVEMVALAATRRTPEQLAQLHQICQRMRAEGNTAKQMAELD